jgi:hypothetical protein
MRINTFPRHNSGRPQSHLTKRLPIVDLVGSFLRSESAGCTVVAIEPPSSDRLSAHPWMRSNTSLVRVSQAPRASQNSRVQKESENSRLSSVVAIFPVIGHTGIAEDKPNELGEDRLGANIIGQDDDATLSGLDADHGICSDLPHHAFGCRAMCPVAKRLVPVAALSQKSLLCAR